MKFLFNYLKLFLIVFLVCVGHFAYKYWDKMSVRQDMQKVEMSEFGTWFRTDTPIAPNKYVQALNYPSLKARSEELRSLYNRREQAIEMVEERIKLMRKKELINDAVEKSVQVNLSEARKINANLFKQIKNIIDFAESQYASDMVRHDSQEDKARAKRIAEENERLLEAVNIPQKFK